MRKVIFFLFLEILLFTKPSSLVANAIPVDSCNNFIIFYENNIKFDSASAQYKVQKLIEKSNSIFLYFETGFSDSLVILLNNKIVFNGYLKTNMSTDFTGFKLLCLKENNNIIKIYTYSACCLEVKLEKKYGIIRINKEYKKCKWYLNYSNNPQTYE